MKLIRYDETMLGKCSEFWWKLYKDRPYVVRPDGYQDINNPTVGSALFAENLNDGLSEGYSTHWCGEVTPDSITVAEDNGEITGLLVCSIDRENLTGTILSGFMRQDQQGREVAELLLDDAVERFRQLGLKKAVVGNSGTLEVERPLHIAALDAGFAWHDSWDQPDYGYWDLPHHGYGAVMGMWFRDFRLRPEIKQKIAELEKQGITFRSLTLHELRQCKRLDTHQPPDDLDPSAGPCYGAFLGDHLVGWLAWVCICGLKVIPSYRRKGIGTVLLHLVTDEIVRGGGVYDYTVVRLHSPTRVLLQSAGYQYWYLGYSGIWKDL